MTGIEIALIAVAVAGTAAAIQAQQQAARAQAAIVERNANQQAADAEQQALLLDREAGSLGVQRAQDALVLERNLALFDQQVEDFEAQEVANIGASGFEFSGSPIVIAMENARRNALNRANLVFGAELEDRRLADQTGLIQFRASEARRRGVALPAIGRFEAQNIRTAGRLQSLSTGLGGAARVGGILMQPRTPTTELRTNLGTSQAAGPVPR